MEDEENGEEGEGKGEVEGEEKSRRIDVYGVVFWLR